MTTLTASYESHVLNPIGKVTNKKQPAMLIAGVTKQRLGVNTPYLIVKPSHFAM
jgi:hypothetical protein